MTLLRLGNMLLERKWRYEFTSYDGDRRIIEFSVPVPWFIIDQDLSIIIKRKTFLLIRNNKKKGGPPT